MASESSAAERAKIEKAITETDSISAAAESLGCSRRTLQNRMRAYGISPGKAGRRKRDLPYSRTTERVIKGLGVVAVIGAGVFGYRHLRKG